MKRNLSGLVFFTLLIAAPAVIFGDTVVFNDTFGNGSTVQSAAPANPTANSTAYEFFQGASAPSGITIAAGDLHLAERSTTSEIGEVQALFTTTPVTLSSIGDWIDLTVVFTDTSGILVAGTGSTSASSLNVGLFSAGGVKPTQGRQLSNGSVSGGATSWNSYGAKFFGNIATSTPQIFQRLPQTQAGTSSQNLDLVFDGQSGSGFNNPSQSVIAQAPAGQVTLTASSVYTLDYRITLSAANTLTINNAIYSGNSVVPGNLVFAHAGATNSANAGDLVYTYDGLAFGWREVFSPSSSSSADISSITVTRNDLVVPEPGSFALLGLGAAGLLILRRR